MVYTLLYQSEELFKSSYYELRNLIDSSKDVIHLAVSENDLKYLSSEEIYKKVLRLDGKYRSDYNQWTAPPIKVRVISRL